MKYFFYIFILLLIIYLPSCLAAETSTTDLILTLGRSSVGKSPHEIVTAKELAVKDALRQAIIRTVIEIADPIVLKNKLEIIEHEILLQASRFITSYAIQASSHSSEGITTLVSVNLERSILAKALNELGLVRINLSIPKEPEFLVLVSEESAPEMPAIFWWSEIPGIEAIPVPISKTLIENNCRIIEPKTILGRIPLALRQPILTENQAIELARLAGANLVILGRIRTYPFLSQTNESISLAAQMEILSIPNGQVVATIEEIGPVFNRLPIEPMASQQLITAIEIATHNLLTQAKLYSTNLSKNNVIQIFMEVNGLHNLNDVFRFENAIIELSPLVRELHRESLSIDVATYRIQLSSSLDKLIEELKILKLTGLQINTNEIRPNRLRVKLTSKL